MRRLLPVLLLVSACGGNAAPPTTTMPAPATSTTAATTTTTTAPAGTIDATTTTAAPTTTEDPVFLVEIAVLASGPVLRVQGIETAPGSRVEVDRGALVRIVTSGEVAEEVHIHAYDHEIGVTPGVEQVFEFLADIPGSFEVELHSGQRLLFRLVVS